MHISEKVDELYRLYGTYNPTTLADFLEIQIRYVPFLSNPDGQFITMFDRPVILLNEKLHDSPKRHFVIAHELYHALEHANLAGYYVANNKFRGKLEREANRFAFQLTLKFKEDQTGEPTLSLNDFYDCLGIKEDIGNYITRK